ncbi:MULTISPECIES: hypothetical protein [unclassified Bradyrhizobium]|jgi:hypothetical protein|uniref:hypothetical protein n=1 Tax=unclassified Bradyrhizobium TaxID=2631580 RepID=UPI001FF8B3BA|nr:MULTISPECIES: hypothetical protein [unclassified Bradyrhizobium]MCK1598494.1 hypothetical protein [Bradyrhizobium sp. 164]UPK31383.1 hypothetical protein IVB26_42150 [Bradyrhizobium sp. 195]
MKSEIGETRSDRLRRTSPTAWAIGAIFTIAVVAAIVFYNGRDIRDQTTTSNPNSAPSVTTGAKQPAQP